MLLALFALAFGPPARTAAESVPIPALRWTCRSDWMDVTKDVTPRAVGDGTADDTAALQAGLDRLSDQPGGRCTLYLPPGTYRITRTLVLRKRDGITLIGCGRLTRITWDGPGGTGDDSRMFWSEGTPRSLYRGIVWDGRGKAYVGFDHDSHSLFETEVDHRDEAFLDFTGSGFRVGHDQARAGGQAAAETTLVSCLFRRCAKGVSLLQFNDYDFTIAGCEFLDCGTGLYGGKGCNFYVRDSRFERSRETDVEEHGEHGCSVRRCTSVGSSMFIRKDSIAALTVQDCQVSSWTNPTGAVTLNWGPVLLFDCAFTRPPGAHPPVVPGQGERLVVSRNTSPGTTGVLKPGGQVVDVPAGRLGGSLRSPTQRFLSARADVPPGVLDARSQFGAKGDGTSDDTRALQACIDAARKAGHGTMAYVPSGDYVVSAPLQVTGKDYRFGGSGIHTRLIWRGSGTQGGGAASRKSPSIVEVTEPQAVVVENLDLTSGTIGTTVPPLAYDISHSGGPQSSARYERVWVTGMYRKERTRGFGCHGLPAGAIVVADHLTGNLDLLESGDSTLLLNASYEGIVTTQDWEGSAPRTGLIGFQTRLATINKCGLYVRGGTNLVMSDYYVEQADQMMDIRSLPEAPPGRITIGMPKSHQNVNPAILLEDYAGRVTIGPSMPYPGGITPMRIVQSGQRPVSLVWMASQAYEVKPSFELAPSARLTLAGNAGASPPDSITPQGLKDIADSLDDLRRLGQLDLQLNYGVQPAGGTMHPEHPATREAQ